MTEQKQLRRPTEEEVRRFINEAGVDGLWGGWTAEEHGRVLRAYDEALGIKEITNESMLSEDGKIKPLEFKDEFVVVRNWSECHYLGKNGKSVYLPQIIILKPEEDAPVSVRYRGIGAHSPAKATLFRFIPYAKEGDEVVYRFKGAYESPEKKDLLVARSDITGVVDKWGRPGEFPYSVLTRDETLAGPDSALEKMIVMATANSVVPYSNGRVRFEPSADDRTGFAKEAADYLLKQGE
jgi:hypothetical protein